MAKRLKQQEIPGFERQVDNEAVEAAAVKYYGIVFERSALSKKEAVAKLELQATMAAQKVTKYRFWDENAEAWRIARIDVKETVVIDKEADTEDAPVEDGSIASDEGILADAKKAQRDAGVAEEDGDIVVPDAPAAKAKGQRKKKDK